MSVSYIPGVEERPYYEGLFRAADTAGKGSIGGGEAVQFFARSKLPIEVLKNVWTVADQPSTSSLDLKKFAVAVRLIQLTQNGQKGQGPTLAVPEGLTLRPAFFEGVSGVTVPLPPAAGQPMPPRQQQHEAPLSPLSVQRSPGQTQRSAPPGVMQQPAVGNNLALVAQDPYTMTPQDRARYEDLFPQYAKPDGFVYGKEAVELFMKSGVDQAVLREIWNLVDRPVDNRLDKLEFALAMHLIVCISKKNLPPPRGNLPNSLKALKAASSTPAGAGQPPPVPPTKQMPLSPKPVEIHSPPRLQTSMGLAPSTSFPSAGPPPIVPSGGVSISDAFEGLNMPSAGPSTLPSYVPEQHQPAFSALEAAPERPASVPVTVETAATPEPIASSPPRPSSVTSNHDMGFSHQELEKLKAVVQKLQAENISLKAQLGGMSEEEKGVHKELGGVIADIGALSSELQTRRAEVLQAKTRLLEASAELKSARDRKGVIVDLIQEAKETKSAIDDATEAMQNAAEASHHTEQKKTAAMQMSSSFESNLFDFNGGSAPAPVPAPAPATDLYSQTHVAPPKPVESAAFPMVQTVSSDAEDASEEQDNEHDQKSPVPVAAPAPAPIPTSAPFPQPTEHRYQAPPTPQYQQPSVHTQPRSAQPSPQLARPGVVGTHHPRQLSGFDVGSLMGGSAEPLPVGPDNGFSPAARATSSSADFGYEDEEMFKNVEELKKKAERAAEAARDAEVAHQKLINEADELRSDADKAEASARSLKAAAVEKKGGLFGRKGGDKKKMNREFDRAAEDAQDIRKRFMEVQGQVRDAGAVAIELRREADKLRAQAEEAELEMAAAASMRDQQKQVNAHQQAPPAQNGYPSQPPAPYGYGYPQMHGQGPPPSYGQQPQGYGQVQQPPQGYGYGQPSNYGQPPGPQYGQMSAPADNGFAPGGMGGPSPQAFW